MPSHTEQVLGALVGVVHAERPHGAGESKDEVQETPGVEVDVQVWDVVGELERQDWD